MSNPYFWRTQYGIDKEQRERIESLEYSLASQARRLRSQFAKAQGSLEGRLSALAQAFDAFVELGDVRAELMLFGDAAVARHRVRGFLAEVLAGRAATLGVEDVPGYWLVPAARALDARLAGDAAGAAAFVTVATELDAPRSTLFLTAMGALLDLPGVTAVQLAALLPASDPADQPVTRAQRAVWLAAADGRFGAAGQALLGERLAALVPAPSDDAGAERDHWRTTVLSFDSAPVAAGLPTQRRAAAALAALYAHCAESLGAAPPASSEVDDAEPADDAGETSDPLVDVVRSLVDEGSPAEIPLLRRSEELRRVVESGATKPEPHQSWDAAAGTFNDLIRADCTPQTPLARRAVALRASRRWLAETADALAAEAVSEPPRTMSARSAGRTIAVGLNGADPAQYAAAERQIDTSYQPAKWPRLVTAAASVVGVAVAVAGFAAGIRWLGMAALVAVAVAAVQLYRQVREGTERAASATAAKTALRQEVEKVQAQLAAAHEAASAARRQAHRDREALTTLLS